MNHLWTPWRMPYLKQDSPGPNSECIFCKKLAGKDDVAEHMLHRGENCFVTLNLYPYNNGHLLVVPNRHVGSLGELAQSTLNDLMHLTQLALKVLQVAYAPQGFNIGINQGSAAGAGIAEHLHQHIVPRWSGDTNYMTSIAQTRIIPEWIDESYEHLKPIWDELFSS